jgi:hypothetical protein
MLFSITAREKRLRLMFSRKVVGTRYIRFYRNIFYSKHFSKLYINRRLKIIDNFCRALKYRKGVAKRRIFYILKSRLEKEIIGYFSPTTQLKFKKKHHEK